MAQAQAAYLPRGLVTRRAGLAMLVMAIGLAVIGAFAANAYIAGEASKVAAPSRSIYVAGADIAAGAFVTPADLRLTQMPISDEAAPFYVGPAAAVEGAPPDPGPAGIAMKALRQGQPILAGDILPAEIAGSVAPLIPLNVKVGDQEQPVVGGLNLPLGALVAPPPPIRVNDRIDVWASFLTEEGTASATDVVIADAQVLAIVGTAEAPSGLILGVTAGQLDRFLFYSNSGAGMIITVRSSQRP